MIQRLTLSCLLFSVGGICLLLAAFFIWQRHTPQRLSFKIKQIPAQQQSVPEALQPVAIIIEDLKIELPISPVTLENGRWQTTSKGIAYLTDSAIPGERGNSVLYGHNWPNLLGGLTQAQKGQEIYIQRLNGEVKRFVIIETSVVTPDQTHILSPSLDARLTIYTCTGFLDKERFVAVAKLQSED